MFGQQGHYSKEKGQGKWQVILSLALLATLIVASFSGVETRRTGTAPFDVHLNPNSGLIALSLALLLCFGRVLTLTVISRVCYNSYTVLAPKGWDSPQIWSYSAHMFFIPGSTLLNAT